VGLSQRAHHRPNQLSGGEQQRVAIARALVNSPSMLLADEPTGNLDTQTGAEIVALLEELHREGMTLVVVTHSLEIATRAGRVVTFRDGRVVSDAASRPGAPS
jgi:putative ABC transport system ATP-binding protein